MYIIDQIPYAPAGVMLCDSVDQVLCDPIPKVDGAKDRDQE
jgi:hypothetical protein